MRLLCYIFNLHDHSCCICIAHLLISQTEICLGKVSRMNDARLEILTQLKEVFMEGNSDEDLNHLEEILIIWMQQDSSWKLSVFGFFSSLLTFASDVIFADHRVQNALKKVQVVHPNTLCQKEWNSDNTLSSFYLNMTENRSRYILRCFTYLNIIDDAVSWLWCTILITVCKVINVDRCKV